MKRTSMLGFFSAAIVVPALASAAAAQTDEGLGRVIRQLEPDERLRIQTIDTEERLEGRFSGMDDGGLILAGSQTDSGRRSVSGEPGSLTGGEQLHVPVAEIERLWTRGRSTGKGAWIGAIGGLVLGAVYGIAISEVTCAESSCTTLGLAAATAGVGAAGGAALGALVGLAIPRWKLEFP